MTQCPGRLCDAVIVVSILQCLGNGLGLLVERHIAQFLILRQAVVMSVRGSGLHRLEGPLMIDARNLLDNHVGKHGYSMVAYHAPGLIAVERPDRQHFLDAPVIMLQH